MRGGAKGLTPTMWFMGLWIGLDGLVPEVKHSLRVPPPAMDLAIRVSCVNAPLELESTGSATNFGNSHILRCTLDTACLESIHSIHVAICPYGTIFGKLQIVSRAERATPHLASGRVWVFAGHIAGGSDTEQHLTRVVRVPWLDHYGILVCSNTKRCARRRSYRELPRSLI